MQRREFLLASSIGLTTLLAGCAGTTDDEGSDGGGSDDSENSSDEESGDGSSDGNDDGNSNDDEENQDDENGDEDDGDDSDDGGDGSSGLSARVEYDGEWSGAVGSDGSTRSVDGEGSEEFEIEEGATSVSINAQKQDDSDDELTVQILEDGEVAAEQSTTAEFGVAQASESFF